MVFKELEKGFGVRLARGWTVILETRDSKNHGLPTTPFFNGLEGVHILIVNSLLTRLPVKNKLFPTRSTQAILYGLRDKP